MKFDCNVPEEFDKGLKKAAKTALDSGNLVVLPTDTVYGLAADAFSPHAVQSISMPRGVAAVCRRPSSWVRRRPLMPWPPRYRRGSARRSTRSGRAPSR